jgi:hypothetical protein
MGLLPDLVAIQREIYLACADRIGDFARTGDWTLLAAYLPTGILFGAVLVHVGMPVLIALLSLPLVSEVLGSVGRAPLLEDFGREVRTSGGAPDRAAAFCADRRDLGAR